MPEDHDREILFAYEEPARRRWPWSYQIITKNDPLWKRAYAKLRGWPLWSELGHVEH